MALIEDAKAILGQGSGCIDSRGYRFCRWCQNPLEGPAGREHAPNCPWLSMPRIVAVLEAAETLAERFDRFNDGSGADEEVDGGLYAAARDLVAALRGEGGQDRMMATADVGFIRETGERTETAREFLLRCGGCPRFDHAWASEILLADEIDSRGHEWVKGLGWQAGPVRCRYCTGADRRPAGAPGPYRESTR